MRVLIVFDIPAKYDPLRARLRNLLKNYGGVFRQYSVYEADLTSRELERLTEKIEGLLKRGGGRVDIIIPCGRCLKGIIELDTSSLL